MGFIRLSTLTFLIRSLHIALVAAIVILIDMFMSYDTLWQLIFEHQLLQHITNFFPGLFYVTVTTLFMRHLNQAYFILVLARV